MPGTLLLADLERSNQDELAEHLNGLYGAPSPPPVAPPSTIQPPPPDVMQELGGHLQNLLGSGLNTIGEGLSNVGQGAQKVPQELQTHVQNLLAAPPPTAPTPAPTPATEAASPTSGEASGDLRGQARQAAIAAGLDPDIFVRQIQQESSFDPGARSPAGAQGVAQFMPGTGAGVARQMGVSEADFWADPGLQLRGAATHMRDLLSQFGGDYAKALAAYNAGPGNVQKYGGVPPFEETQRYVQTILGGAGEVARPFVEGARAVQRAVTGAPARDISQFGDAQLTASEAAAACGPAAAVRFAQRHGRNPTLREATDLAASVGWTQHQGMAGIGSEQQLLERMGVSTKLVQGADWGAFADEASTGNPVVISTRGHYFYADNWDRASNRFHVGRSGMDLKGGKEWMTPDEMTALMGEVQGGLLASNPVTPASTTETPPSFTSPVAGAPSPQARISAGGGVQSLDQAHGQGLTILDDAIDRVVKPADQQAAAAPGREAMPLIEPPPSFSSPSAEPGPLERVGSFFEGLGTDVRRQQSEAQAQNPYLGGVAGGGFSDPGTAITAGLERAGVPGHEDFGFEVGPLQVGPREVAGFASGLLPSGSVGAKVAREALEDAAPELAGAAGRALRSRLPAEAEVGFAAGMPTGGTRPPTPPRRTIDYDALAEMRARRAAEPDLEGEAAQPNLADKAMSFMVNNILSNPASLVMNPLSSVSETLGRPAVSALSGELGPAAADVSAMGRGIGDALAAAGDTFMHGRRAVNAIDQPEAFPGRVGIAATPALRTMGATDEFTRSLNVAGAQAAEMTRLMRQHPELSQAEILQQFEDDILAVGERAAGESVFTEGGTGVGRWLAGIRRQATAPGATPGQRLGGLTANVVVPFSVVPDVILKKGFGRVAGINEIRAAVEVIPALARGDTLAARRSLAGASMAAMTNAAIAEQVRQGNITGSGPRDPSVLEARKNARDADGDPVWRPNSIRVGKQWVPYSSLGPVAIQMGAIANAAEQYEESGKQVDPDVGGAFAAALGETIMDAWYLQTLSGAFNAIQNQRIPEWLGNQALSTATRVVPEAGALNFIRGVADPTVRDPKPKLSNPDTWLDYFANRMPVASQTVQPRIDPATGEPTQEPRTLPSALLRASATGEPNRANELLARHNLGVADAPKAIAPVEGLQFAINDQEQRRFEELAGPEIEQRVVRLADSPTFQGLPPESRRDLLQDAVRDGREIAVLKLAQTIPSEERLRRIRAYREAERRRAESGI